ncbi:MAG: metallophosphoesterase [Candidatus Margulisiibacteriota bacterium]|nr:metallophosphoesterase [Candidatus Margulisiibacteriota bacterium]
MKNNLKILHLSDPHIGYRNCGRRFRSIARNIINREKADEIVIVLTGDLVESAFSNRQLDEAVEIINTLKKEGFKVLVAPGNHDYGNGWVNTRSIGQKFMGAFGLKFPRIDVIGDALFVGLDSNVEEIHWYDRFFADGEIGDEQLNKLDEIINRKDFQGFKKIIYFHHHPIDLLPFHKLKDHLKLKRIIAGKVDIVLYGHNHAARDHSGWWGIKIMLDGGSSTGKRMLFKKVKHRIINLSDFSISKRNFIADNCRQDATGKRTKNTFLSIP